MVLEVEVGGGEMMTSKLKMAMKRTQPAVTTP